MFKSLLIKFCHLIFLIVVGNIISWKDLKEDNVLWLLAPVDDISRAGILRDPVFLITLGLIGRQPPVIIKLSHSEGNVCRATPSHSALSLPLMACVKGLVSKSDMGCFCLDTLYSVSLLREDFSILLIVCTVRETAELLEAALRDTAVLCRWDEVSVIWGITMKPSLVPQEMHI